MESFHIHSNSHSEFCYFNFQSSVAWTSQIFRWLYSDLVIVNDLLQSWVQALNEHSKKNAEEVSKSCDRIRWNTTQLECILHNMNE